MFGEFFAYYLGKSAGRSQERRRRRGRGPLTKEDVARARFIFVVISACIVLAALAGVIGHLSW